MGAGHYKGVNEIIVFEKDDGHYDVSATPPCSAWRSRPWLLRRPPQQQRAATAIPRPALRAAYRVR